MLIQVQGNNKESTENALRDILDDIQSIESNILLSKKVEMINKSYDRDVHSKGDPVTFLAIALSVVSAGGAISQAVSDGGLITKVVELLFEYHKKGLKVTIEKDDGRKISLDGDRKVIEEFIRSAIK